MTVKHNDLDELQFVWNFLSTCLKHYPLNIDLVTERKNVDGVIVYKIEARIVDFDQIPKSKGV